MKFAKYSLLLSAIALAASVSAAPLKTNNHAYVAAQLGYGSLNSGNESATARQQLGDFTKTTGGLAYRVSGGYLFGLSNKFDLGPEIGYLGYPESKYSNSTKSIDFKFTGYTIDILANAQYHFNDQFFGVGKAGLAYVTQELDITHHTNSLEDKTKNKLLPEVSLGVGYTITPQMSLTATANYTFGGASPASGDSQSAIEEVANVSAYMVGFNYLFS